MTTAAIESHKIEIRWTRLPAVDADLGPLLALLSPDEQARAARFKVERPRRCFIVAHAFLRTLLGSHLGVAAEEVGFRYGDHGKPYLEYPASAMHFNLSHSGDLVVVGLTAATELGVDVEMLRPMPRAERLAERFFSAAEAKRVAELEGEHRLQAFFHLWTAKEAYLKAVGTGITTPLREVEVAPELDAPRLVAIGGDADEASRWSLLRPESPAGSMVTVAIPGQGWSVQSREWSALTG